MKNIVNEGKLKIEKPAPEKRDKSSEDEQPSIKVPVKAKAPPAAPHIEQFNLDEIQKRKNR